MRVFINKRERQINSEKISYSVVVNYGLCGLAHFDRIAPTVTYRYAHQKADTPMEPKSSLRLQEGMHFTVLNGKRVSQSPATQKNIQPWPVDPDAPTTDPPRVWPKQEAIDRRNAELQAQGKEKLAELTQDQIQAICPTIAALPDSSFKQLWAKKEAEYQARQRASAALSEPQALLKDAYIIINLLYQEAVEAGRMTPGRLMAGRLLYSAGYTETVKHLENQ